MISLFQGFRGALKKEQRGFASIEYMVVTLIVIFALFMPIPGTQGLTAVGLLMTGLKNFQLHTVLLLSMP